MSGFIDPDERIDKRLDRLDALLAEVLPLVGIESLSSEAQSILADLKSENAVRKERGRRRFAALAAADPLPADLPVADAGTSSEEERP